LAKSQTTDHSEQLPKQENFDQLDSEAGTKKGVSEVDNVKETRVYDTCSNPVAATSKSKLLRWLEKSEADGKQFKETREDLDSEQAVTAQKITVPTSKLKKWLEKAGCCSNQIAEQHAQSQPACIAIPHSKEVDVQDAVAGTSPDQPPTASGQSSKLQKWLSKSGASASEQRPDPTKASADPESKLQRWLSKSEGINSPPAAAAQPTAAAAPSSKLQKWLSKGACAPAAAAAAPAANATPSAAAAGGGSASVGSADENFDPRMPVAQCVDGIVRTGFKSVSIDEKGKVRAVRSSARSASMSAESVMAVAARCSKRLAGLWQQIERHLQPRSASYVPRPLWAGKGREGKGDSGL
jgi:hypothetical protein